MRRSTAIVIAMFTAVAMLGLGACSSSDESGSGSTSESDAGSKEKSKSDTAKKSGSKKVGKSPKLSGEAADYADAIVVSMTSDESMPLTEEQARCYANRAVDLIGVDRFKDAGVKPGSMNEPLDYSPMKVTEGEANKIYDQFDECGIDMRAAMLSQMSADDDLSAESKECFERALDGDNLRKFMVSTMVHGDSPEANSGDDNLMSTLMACAFMDMDESSFNPDGAFDSGMFDD